MSHGPNVVVCGEQVRNGYTLLTATLPESHRESGAQALPVSATSVVSPEASSESDPYQAGLGHVRTTTAIWRWWSQIRRSRTRSR